MKHKCSFILKASTALVLALLMLFGTVTTSIAAVVDNAEPETASGSFFAAVKAKIDIADTGAKADLAETGADWDLTGVKLHGNINSNGIGAGTAGTDWNDLAMIDSGDHRVWSVSAVLPKDTALQFGFKITSSSSYSDSWYSGNTNSYTDDADTYKKWYNLNGNGGNLTVTVPDDADYYICVFQFFNVYDSNDSPKRARVDFWPAESVIVHHNVGNNASSNKLYVWSTVKGGYGDENARSTTNSFTNNTLHGTYGNEPNSTNAAEGVTGFTKNWYTTTLYYSTFSDTVSSVGMKIHNSTDTGNLSIDTSDLANGEIWINGSSGSTSCTVSDRTDLRTEFADAKYATAYNGGTDNGTYTPATYAAFKDAYEDAADALSDYATTQQGIDDALTALQSAYAALVLDDVPRFNSFTITSDSLRIGDTTSVSSETKNFSGTVTYTSSDTDVVKVSGTTVTAVGEGDATITATLVGTSPLVTATVDVSVSTPTIAFGDTSAVTLNIDGTTTRTATGSSIGSSSVTQDSITYSSNAPSIATISNVGLITGVAPGDTTVTATRTIICDGVTTVVSTTVNVSVHVNTPSITAFSASPSTINLGETSTLSSTTSGTNKTVTYSIKAGSTDKVSLSDGIVTAIAPGTATLVASLTDGGTTYTREVDITILTPGLSFSYSPSVIYTEGPAAELSATPSTPVATNANAEATVTNVTYTVTTGGSSGTISDSSDGTVTSTSTAGTVTVTATGTVTYNEVSYPGAVGTATVTVYNRPEIHLVGGLIGGGWLDSAANKMTYNAADDCWYLEWDLSTTNSYPQNNNNGFGFNVKRNNNSESLYKNSSTMNSSNCTNWTFTTSANNCGITPSLTGTYIFKVTLDNDETSNPVVSVLYPHQVTYNANGHGTPPASEVVKYGDYAAEPLAPTETGYTFDGWFTEAGCENEWTFATDTVTADQTLYAKWTENKVDVYVKAFTGNTESTTGGTVSPTNVNVGITTGNYSVATAAAAAGYVFTGWEVVGSHISLYTDAACSTPYDGSRSYTTVWIRTDGTSPLDSAANYVKANFIDGARTYVVGQMVKDDNGNYTIAKASASSNTSDGFNAVTTIADSGNVVMYGTASMSTTGDISATDTQNPAVTDYSSYVYTKYEFMGWKKSDTALTEISGSNTTWDETDASITPTVPVTGEGYWYACYRKQYVFCAFRSYDYDAGQTGQIVFIAGPPSKYQIGSDAAASYANQGQKFAIPAGETLKLTYTTLASSDSIEHVYYDDTDYTTATPTAENFNSSNQHEITSGITIDQSAHEVSIVMNQNYKNIHIALGSKLKLFFSEKENIVIHAKNVDNYYAPGEAISGDTEAKYLTVSAAGSANQTNTITSANVKFYYCNSAGKFTDASGNLVDEPVELPEDTLIFESGDSANSGETDGTARKITGTMPNSCVYVDLDLDVTYELYLGTRMVSDIKNNYVTWAKVADTSVAYQGHTFHDTDWNTQTYKKLSWNSGTITAVDNGDAVTLSWSFWDKDSSNNPVDYNGQYKFLGWYKGTADGPDYSKKSLISEKQTYTYPVKSNVYVYALGTRDLFINGTKYIRGDDTDWGTDNIEMSFDPYYKKGDNQGRYYYELTQLHYDATAGGYTATVDSGDWIRSGIHNDTTNGAAADSWGKQGNSWFRIYDTATITNDEDYSNLNFWKDVTPFNKTETNEIVYGKAKNGDVSDSTDRSKQGLGYIIFNDSDYPAYSAPIRIYVYPDNTITVEPTPVYSNLYVSNGFGVGDTANTSAVTVSPVYEGDVVLSGETGYFNIADKETFSPTQEGAVHKYVPEQKNATVRIKKTCSENEKVVAFFVYDLDNDSVSSIKDVQNSGNDYYIHLTVELQQNLYIVPTIEEKSADVTINFDATQLNKDQWGDIVTCYAWYSDGAATPALGRFPGQPMVVSDNRGSWSAKFPSKKTIGGTEYNLAGITFANYVDGDSTWLGTTGNQGTKVMSTVNYSTPHGTTDGTHVWGGVGSISSVADDGLIKQYNKVISGKSQEYSRQNFKAQTYDYREPIAIFANSDHSEGVETTITFAMKDGDSSLLSWRHAELLNNNIINLPDGWTKLNWEYLTDSTGNKYSDLNGRALAGKPTATFYIAAKGGYIYNNGNVTAAFYSGKSYDTADHSYVNTDDYTSGLTNEFTPDGTPTGASSANYGWVHDGCPSTVSYGDASNTSADPADIDFNYAVQWYVYDAAGNYITTVLSAAFGDMNNEKTQTYIARELESKGYAVDGKAVSICYDKPRYYYWDTNGITYSAVGWNGDNINSGEGFAGYRFTGQWYTTVKTEPVTVDVKVGMMTESGEVMADSNVMPYGSATAVFSTVNGTASYAHSNDGTRSVTVAVADSEKRLVKLDADETNFIGWYYYDTNTGELTEAPYKSNADFFPNFNKDVTYYALYKHAATYSYKYRGREGNQSFSSSGGDLTEAELADNKIDWGVGQRTTDGTTGKYDIKKLAPGGDQISVFKKTINFSSLDYTSESSYDTSTDYTLIIGPFTNTVASFNLTYYYYKSKGGELASTTQSLQYNQTVDMQGEVADAVRTNAPDGTMFIGWYEFDASKEGDARYGRLLTQQANYGFVMTKEMTIAAKYAVTKEADDSTWRAFIDDNEVSRELDTASSGRYYNDTIVRFRQGTNAAATVPEGSEVGVLILNDGKSDLSLNPGESRLETYASALANNQTAKIGSGGRTVTELSFTVGEEGYPLTYYNRFDFALRSDYASTKNSKYAVYAFVKIGDTYYWSAVAEGTYS